MTPSIYDQLLAALRGGPLPLDRIHALAREAGSAWSEPQLRLFLTCMDGIELDASSPESPMVRLGQRTEQEALMEALLEVLRAQGGGPLHPGALKKLLPGRFTTTEEQLKALARKTPALEVMGPGLIRIR